MSEQVIGIMVAFLLGWFVAVSSGALFAYIVFRTKKEQHESLFPAKRKPKHYGGSITRDEFAAGEDDDEGLPDVIKKMNARMGAELATAGLKDGKK